MSPSKSTSNFTKCFVDPKSWKAVLEEKYDESLWSDSFYRCVKPVVRNATARDTSHLVDDFIAISDLKTVIYDCLGAETPSFIVDKFMKLGSQLATKERNLSWTNFK